MPPVTLRSIARDTFQPSGFADWSAAFRLALARTGRPYRIAAANEAMLAAKRLYHLKFNEPALVTRQSLVRPSDPTPLTRAEATQWKRRLELRWEAAQHQR